MLDIIYYKNDTLVSVEGVKDASTNTYINNALVRILSINNYDGTLVTGTFPIQLAYVASSNGVYKGNIPSYLSLEPNSKYVCKLEVVTDDNLKAYWEFNFTCRIRNN